MSAGDTERLLAEVRSLLADLRIAPGRPVTVESDLQRELGLDSLAVVELFDRVERAFAVRLSDDVLADAATPAEWLRAIDRARARGGSFAGHPPARTALQVASVSRPEEAATIVEALSWHADRHPDRVSVRVLDGDGGVQDLSYGALQAAAIRLAGALRAERLARGERVAIMLPTGAEYFQVFLGVLAAGLVPVPIYPPARRDALAAHLRRQARLLANAGAAMLVTVHEALLPSRLLRSQLPALRSVETPESLWAKGGDGGPLVIASPSDIALLQYTSGSTGDPKGVVLTERQILANIAAMGSAAGVTSDDVFVSWLPLYHDMGLIGAFLAPLYFGFPLVVFSPLRFLARPASWLDVITREGGTISAAPSFAFQACVERVQDSDLQGIDLSRWRIAFNGSEPVSPTTIERFVGRFSRCGFSREAMCPAYGLAEVGVGLSFSPPGRGPRLDVVDGTELQRSGRALLVDRRSAGSRVVVSCGTVLPGYEVQIRDSEARELPDRHEGRVFVRGPSATEGYFANERASAELWKRGFLDTGDLGYVADGELYLTGRAKDLVIRAGRNLHPEELEQAVGALDAVVPGGVAAFAAADQRRGTEQLVVVVETNAAGDDARAGLREDVRSRTVDLLGTPPDEVVLVRPGMLLRTPSGKLRRGATRDAFVAGRLEKEAGSPLAVQLLRLAASGLRPAARRLAEGAAQRLFAAYAWVLALDLAAVAALVVGLPLPLRARWRAVRLAGETLRRATGIRLSIEGPLPGDVTQVLVANHESFVDGLVLLLAFHDPVVFVASTDLRDTPVVGRFLARIGCVFVERGRADRGAESVEQLATAASGGRTLVVFPEGSITRAPGVRPFHLGAFAVAARVGCPVVPVGVRGSRNVLRPGTYRPRREPITLTFGDPISPRGRNFEAQVALREAVREAVGTLAREPLA